MKSWDLATGAGKMELAQERLKAACDEAERYWSDDAYRKFHESYIATVDPKIRNVLDALHRLSEVIAAAERQCGRN